MKKITFLLAISTFILLSTEMFFSCDFCKNQKRDYALSTLQCSPFRGVDYIYDSTRADYRASDFRIAENTTVHYDSLFINLYPEYNRIAHRGISLFTQAVACSPAYQYFNYYDSIEVLSIPSFDGVQTGASSILPYLGTVNGDTIRTLEAILPKTMVYDYPGSIYLSLRRAPHQSGNYKFIVRASINGQWQSDTSDYVFIEI